MGWAERTTEDRLIRRVHDSGVEGRTFRGGFGIVLDGVENVGSVRSLLSLPDPAVHQGPLLRGAGRRDGGAPPPPRQDLGPGGRQRGDHQEAPAHLPHPLRARHPALQGQVLGYCRYVQPR